METIFLILVVGVLMALAFLIGARTAQKAQNNAEITLPNINPVSKINELKSDFEANKIQSKFDTELDNINNYHGDGMGQKNIPE